MIRTLTRYWRWAMASIAIVSLPITGWLYLQLLHNPAVELGPPRVVKRPGHAGPVTLVLGGDTAPTDAAQPMLDTHGYRYPYLGTDALLREADVAFLNLESPVTDSNEPYPGDKPYIYKVSPKAVPAWQWLGLDVVSLANNHAADYLERGILDSVRHLDEGGIEHVGAGANESAARAPVIFEVGTTRVGFLAYHEDRLEYALRYRSYAVGDHVGCARFVRDDVAEDVKRLRPLVDVLLVSVHWGVNYQDVTADQEDAARWLADLGGVDVVIGHHSHDMQSVEVRGRTVILYSLGNYAFGTPGRDTLRAGFLARVEIEPAQSNQPAHIRGIELLPLATQNRLVQYQPRPLRPDELPWLDDVVAASRARGAAVTLEGTTVRLKLPW